MNNQIKIQGLRMFIAQYLSDAHLTLLTTNYTYDHEYYYAELSELYSELDACLVNNIWFQNLGVKHEDSEHIKVS